MKRLALFDLDNTLLNGDSDYRRHLATVLTRRAVLAAAGG